MRRRPDLFRIFSPLKPITGRGSAVQNPNLRVVGLFRSILRRPGLGRGLVDLGQMASPDRQALVQVRVRVLLIRRRPTRWVIPWLRPVASMAIPVAGLIRPLRRVLPSPHPMPGSSRNRVEVRHPRPVMAGLDPLAMRVEPAVLRIPRVRSSPHRPQMRPRRSDLCPALRRVRRSFLSSTWSFLNETAVVCTGVIGRRAVGCRG